MEETVQTKWKGDEWGKGREKTYEAIYRSQHSKFNSHPILDFNWVVKLLFILNMLLFLKTDPVDLGTYRIHSMLKKISYQ